MPDANTAAETNAAMWIPPVHKTVATEGKGIAEVAGAIARHAQHLRENGEWEARDRARLGSELEALLRESLMVRFLESIPQETYQQVMESVVKRDISPYEAVEALLSEASSGSRTWF